MSNTQYAFMSKSRVPDAATLQASIRDLGFDLEVDAELDLLNDEGFSPCVLAGVPDVGPELLSGTRDSMVEDDAALAEIAGDNDFCIGMVWRGSMRDCAAVMIVSCALAKDFGAVISYEGEPPGSLEDLMKATREIIDEAKNER